MTFAAHYNELSTCFDDGAAAMRGAKFVQTGVFRRVIETILKSSRRQADREIARFMAHAGPHG
jgi:hypothetical protein